MRPIGFVVGVATSLAFLLTCGTVSRPIALSRTDAGDAGGDVDADSDGDVDGGWDASIRDAQAGDAGGSCDCSGLDARIADLEAAAAAAPALSVVTETDEDVSTCTGSVTAYCPEGSVFVSGGCPRPVLVSLSDGGKSNVVGYPVDAGAGVVGWTCDVQTPTCASSCNTASASHACDLSAVVVCKEV